MNVSVRTLNAYEARQLTAARLVAVEHAPYLAHALFTVQPVAAEGLATFAVDRGWRLYVDPATLVRWGPTLAGGVLVHEVGHLVRAMRNAPTRSVPTLTTTAGMSPRTVPSTTTSSRPACYSHEAPSHRPYSG